MNIDRKETARQAEQELQRIEHATKILQDHLDTVRLVVNETEGMLNTYVPILRTYVEAISELRHTFGEEVMHFAKSTRELKLVVGNTQQLGDFIRAVQLLHQTLTPELTEKLRRLVGGADNG